MVLAGCSDAAYLNVRKYLSCAGAHIMLSEDTPAPNSNAPFLAVAQIIKFVMSSSTKSKMSCLFIRAKAMVQIRQTLIEIGWPQTKSLIYCDNSTTVGVANETIIQCKTKTMNMQYHWIRCREAQCQFLFFWDPGAHNLADYSTKTAPLFIMRPRGLHMWGNHTLFVHRKGVYIQV